MKHIRKISLVMILAIILTIGSVFAVWSYDRGAVSREGTYELHMTDIVSKGEKGSINASNNSLRFKVDDVGDMDWIAALVPEGSVDLQFMHAPNADQSVKDYGIKMRVTVTLQGSQTPYSVQVSDGHGGYVTEEVTILSAKTGGQNSFVLNTEPSKAPVTLTAEQIRNCLDFCDNKAVYLPTYTDNVNFDNAMSEYKIVITITEEEN